MSEPLSDEEIVELRTLFLGYQGQHPVRLITHKHMARIVEWVEAARRRLKAMEAREVVLERKLDVERNRSLDLSTHWIEERARVVELRALLDMSIPALDRRIGTLEAERQEHMNVRQDDPWAVAKAIRHLIHECTGRAPILKDGGGWHGDDAEADLAALLARMFGVALPGDSKEEG